MIDAQVKSVLSGIGGVGVYALQRPTEAPLPVLVYRRISEKDYMSHSGRTNLERVRFQITHVAATYSELLDIVEKVKAAIIGTNSQGNFHAAVSTDNHLEDKESDGVYVSQVDYLIWNKE